MQAVLDRRLDGPPAAPIVVALSGGGDSLALLALTLAWAKPRGRNVLALSVDHGLNPASARWTANAGEAARSLGADWSGLSWEGVKPCSNLQAKARTARHALLAEAARSAGALVILMGHTADDLGEAAAMRASGMPGFGQMQEWSPSPAWPQGRGVFLLRPLLALGRAPLRTHLEALGLSWLEDPANTDERFARVRARKALAQGAIALRGRACALEPDAALARSVSFAPGAAFAPVRRFGEVSDRVAAHTLATLLLSVSGGTTPPRTHQLDRLRQSIEERRPATLSGCKVSVRDGVLSVAREAARRSAHPPPLEPVRWTAARFYAANGMVQSERVIPSLD